MPSNTCQLPPTNKASGGSWAPSLRPEICFQPSSCHCATPRPHQRKQRIPTGWKCPRAVSQESKVASSLHLQYWDTSSPPRYRNTVRYFEKRMGCFLLYASGTARRLCLPITTETENSSFNVNSCALFLVFFFLRKRGTWWCTSASVFSGYWSRVPHRYHSWLSRPYFLVSEAVQRYWDSVSIFSSSEIYCYKFEQYNLVYFFLRNCFHCPARRQFQIILPLKYYS